VHAAVVAPRYHWGVSSAPTTMIASHFAHDALSVLAVVGACAALVGFGFAWGHFRALAVLTALWAIPPIASDILYFGFGVNLIGYCGEPLCDPGPIPISMIVIFLPFPFFLVAVGVRLRQRQSGRER
jgi:hypothetical protein